MSNDSTSSLALAGNSAQVDSRDAGTLYNEALKHFKSFLNHPHFLGNLDSAISLAHQSVSRTIDADPELALREHDLAEMLHRRYDETQLPQDLANAILFAEKACVKMKDDCELLPSCLWLRGVLYDLQYQRTNQECLLDAALENIRKAIEYSPDDLGFYETCAMILIHHYGHFGSEKVGHLFEALGYAEKILSSSSDDLWPKALHQCSVIYSYLNEEDPTGDSINLAVKNARSFLDSASQSKLEIPRAMQALAYALQKSFESTRDPQNLSEAIRLIEDAIQFPELDDDLRLKCMNNLGLLYENRFGLFSDQADLDMAIKCSEDALSETHNNARHNMRWTINLANQFGHYFGWTGKGEYLDRAICKLRDVYKSESVSVRDRIEVESDLARFMVAKARHGDTSDLTEALNLLEKCFKSNFTTEIDRLRHRIRYLDALTALYQLTTNKIPSSEEARIANEALSMIPEDNQLRAEWLESIAEFWHARFGLSEATEDLEKGYSVGVKSVECSLNDHPSYYHRKFKLAYIEWKLYLLFHSSSDEQKASQYYKQAVENCVQAAESAHSFFWTRVTASRVAIKMLGKTAQWDRMMAIGTAAIRDLPILCSRYQSREEQQKHISLAYGLAAETCSACIKAGRCEDGLRYLEYGRALMIGYAIESRGDIAFLEKDQPRLAEEYDMLRMKLLQTQEVEFSNISDMMLQEGRELLNKMKSCIDRIRDTPGHETFLSVPGTEELQACAMEGPIVVVNHTILSSDAILVLSDRTITIPLPDMRKKLDEPLVSEDGRGSGSLHPITELSRDVLLCSDSDSDDDDEEFAKESILQWLWRTCVEPILKMLQSLGILNDKDDRQRTWWIGTGNASSYPFHAAISFREGDSDIKSHTLGWTIPSYVPSIKALSYARQTSQNITKRIDKTNPTLLLVTMPTTPGKAPLPGVEKESRVVKESCKDAYTVTTLCNPSSDAVLQQLGQSNFVHFACHGASHPKDPSRSHLLLQKLQRPDPLDVSRLAKTGKLNVAWIAYLSACSTVEIKNKDLAEEGIHMSTALLLAGFPHVVGSLWEVDDNVSVQMAKNFYQALLDAKQGVYESQTVAEAWRSAVIQTRGELKLAPKEWAVYVHSGC